MSEKLILCYKHELQEVLDMVSYMITNNLRVNANMDILIISDNNDYSIMTVTIDLINIKRLLISFLSKYCKTNTMIC